MPTTREEREAILLKKRGLDPAQWSINNSGMLIQRPPAATATAAPEAPREIGPFETAGRSMVGAIPETLGGAIGGGLGVMGGTAAAPLAGPLAPAAPFVGGIAGGIGGSVVGGKLEEEFAPDAYKEFVSRGREQNPLAAEVGSALPQLLLSNPLKSLKLARDLLRATPTLTRFTPQQLGQLGNVGVGAGMGAGSAIAEDAMGEGVGMETVPKALIRGGAGLLGAEPNALGRVASLGTWKQSPETPDNWKGAAPVARDAMQKSARMETVDGTPVSSKPPMDADIVSSDLPGAVQIGDQAATDAAFAKNAPQQLGTGQPQIEAPPPGPKQLPERTQPQDQGTQLGDTSDEWDKLISDVSARTYKTDAETGIPNLRSSTGQRVAGLAQLPTDLERGLVKISTDAGIDTGPHELLHVIVNDVLERGTPGERRFIKKVVDAAGGEESLVQGGGQEFVRRLVDEAGGQNPSLLKDLASFVKARFGAANKRDLERLAANTLRRGAGSEQYRPDAPNVKAPPMEGENRSKKPNERNQGFNLSADDIAPIQKQGKLHSSQLEQRNARRLRVATKTPEGKIIEGKPGEHHFNIPGPDGSEYGFVTPEGKYLTRDEAAEYAIRSEKPVPESNDTIQKQLELTSDPNSSKRVTLLVPGSPDVPIGDGLRKVKVPQGEAVYNPAKISEADVVAGGAGEQYDGQLLGMSQSVKPGAGDQVVTATKDGVGDVVTEAVAPGMEAPAIKAVSDAVPGGEVEVRPAAEVVNERTQPIGPREVYDPKEKPQRRLDPFKSSIRRLETSGDLRRQETADIFRRAFSRRDVEKGRYSGILREIDAAPKEVADEAYRAMIERDKTGTPPPPLSSREAQALYDAMDATYRQMRLDQNAAGHLVGGRMGKVDPTGMFNVVSPDTVKLLTTLDQSSPTWTALRDDFVHLQQKRGFSNTEAFEAFNRYLNDISSEMSASKAVDFGAVSLPEGMKLPDGWIDPDPFRAWRRYIDRFAKARAWHDVVLKDPRAAAMFDGDNSLARDPDVVAAFSDYTEKPPSGRIAGLSSIGRFINMLRLGPVTRAVDMATTPFKAMAYTPVSNWPAMIGELGNWNKHYEDAFKTGFVRPGGDLVSHDILGAHDAAANIIDKGTAAGTKIQGLEKLEVLARTAAQAFGAQAGGVLRGQARAGDKRAADFLNKLGTDWNTVSPEELGTRIGRLMQGTYDARALPAWMKDSQLAPFVPLARWSTEQWNNFRQFGVEPAMKGDPVPLLRMLFAGTLGALSVGEVRELLNNKKPYIAEIEEIKNAPDGSRAFQEALLKLGTAAQATAMFGIVGDMAVQLGRLGTGKLASGYNFPAMEFTADVAVRTLKAMQAVGGGVPIADVMTQYAKDIGKRNIQALQLVTRNSDETTDANRVRDFRMYRRLAGENDQLPVGNVDYSRADKQAFDKEKDPARAQERAAGLAKRTVKRFPGDNERIYQELNRAGQSRINFAPADYEKRKAYFEYIERTQGKEAAQELEKAYEKTRTLNELKRWMPVAEREKLR